MDINIISKNSQNIAIVRTDAIIIADAQSALDLLATVQHESGSNRIAVYKEAISEDFFNLRTGVAGEVLQKFVNYRVKLAIIGDFSRYTSKALKDFIYESNRGGSIFFMENLDEAVEKLSR